MQHIDYGNLCVFANLIKVDNGQIFFDPSSQDERVQYCNFLFNQLTDEFYFSADKSLKVIFRQVKLFHENVLEYYTSDN